MSDNNSGPKCDIEKRELIEKYVTPASCSGNEEDRAQRIKALMYIPTEDLEDILKLHYILPTEQNEGQQQEQEVNQSQSVTQSQQPRRVTDFNRDKIPQSQLQLQQLQQLTEADKERIIQLNSQKEELERHNNFLAQVNQNYAERDIQKTHANVIKMSEEHQAYIQQRNIEREGAREEALAKQKAKQEAEDRELVFNRQPDMKNKLNEDISKKKQEVKDVIIPKVHNYFSLDSNELADYLNLKIRHRFELSPVSYIIKKHEYREGDEMYEYFTCKCASETQYEELTDIEQHCHSDSPELHKKLTLETIQELLEKSWIINLRKRYESDIRQLAINIRRQEATEEEKRKAEELEERQSKIRKKLSIQSEQY